VNVGITFIFKKFDMLYDFLNADLCATVKFVDFLFSAVAFARRAKKSVSDFRHLDSLPDLLKGQSFK